MALVTGAIGNLVPKLLQLLQSEYELQKNVRKKVEFVARELDVIQAVLHKVAAVPWDQLDEQVKVWAREVRDASYDIEDFLDTYHLRVEGGEHVSRNRLKRAMKKMCGLFGKFKVHREIAMAVDDIQKQLQQLDRRHARYRIDDTVAYSASATTVDPRLSAFHTNASHLIGIEKPRNELIEMLFREDDSSSNEIKSISIVGFGGLGKTTLAKSVYDRVYHKFECGAFVPAGRNPDLKKVLRDIRIDLSVHSDGTSVLEERYAGADLMGLDERQLINLLHRFLEGKRYFIVIDDLWEASSYRLLAQAFVKNNNGSKIIVTTRIFQVASEAGEIYRMKPLSYIDSKRLFCIHMRLFSGEEDFRLAEASDKIIRKYGGVPLAIIAAARMLVERPIEDWLNVIGIIFAQNRASDTSMRILSFSYYDLRINLRPCLLYLSIYPEDYVIEKNMLIWRWIAEGFFSGKATNELFEHGESYFNELIDRSLIQPVEIKGTGLVYGCQVHNLVLQFIRSLACDENFVSVLSEGGEIFPSSEFRRLAIHNRKDEHNLGDNMDQVHPQLRSLTAFECPIYMIPPVFSFKLLRVLDLESCGSMEGYDLKHLGKLLLLKFIGLRNTFVRMLPEELGQLKDLQTLDLHGSGVEDLPASIGGLKSLMCLNADWTTRVADWIGKLTSLQQLVMYPGDGNDKQSLTWLLTGLGNLMELRKLRLLIKADNEKQLRDLLVSVSKLPKIEVLHFDYYGAQLNSSVKLELSGFARCGHLHSLELQLLKFSKLPVWIRAKNLPKICHLSLMLFDVDQQDLEKLGKFTELRHLHLLTVNTQHGDAITCASGGFWNLRFFSITKPFKFLQGAMPRLEVLDFHFNVRLQSGANSVLDVDFGLENIPSLQQVIVQINCLDGFREEVEEAVETLRKAIAVRPNNRLILDISLPRQKLDKADNEGVNDISNRDKGKGVEMVEGHRKLAYYSKSLSSAHDGIDKPMEELIKRLYVVDNEAYHKKMKIVHIDRSKGLGKTTLAQKVFDKLSPHFDCAAFVLVGQNPDIRTVFTDILIGLDKQKYKDFPVTILNIMELIGLVRKSLINKRFFVVIDDIWDLKEWDIIKCALIENSNGSAVLTTTSRQNWEQNWWSSGDGDKLDFDADKQLDPRSTTTDHSLHLDAGNPADVPAVSPSKKPRVEVELISHEPDPLASGIPPAGGTQPEPSLFHDGGYLKGYFYEKLFGSEDNCPDDLKDMCEDLIEISAGILSDAFETVEELRDIDPTLENWQSVYQRRKFDLSYPKLPDYLKNCLSYFSMFPKGYEISAERLVWAWIAQGFVKETQGQQDLQKQEVGKSYLCDLINRKMTEAVEVDADAMALVGKSYLSDLINRKMIEAVEVDADGMALSCRACDLLHDLIVSKSTEENFVAILNDDSQDKVFLPPDKVHQLSIQIQRNNIVHSPPKAWLNKVQSLVVSCDKVPSFTDFRALKAMDLGDCDSLEEGHLKGIGKTTSLTYLAIGGKYIADIPKEVSSLKNLRTLDLTACGLSELPRCVLLLSDLERLFVNSHMKIPAKISKMLGLQELGDINIVKPELLKRLRKLSKLRVLRIAIWSWDEGSKTSVKLWWEALHSLIGSCKNIESLCIKTFCSLDFMDGSDDNKWPPQKLKNLEIRHSTFHHKLPSWFDSLANVSSLTIEVNKLSPNITNTLGKLSALCSLSVTSKEVPEVTFVIDSDTFKKLESLKFVCNAMVQMFAGPQSNASQQLKRLTIVFQASWTKDINKDFRFGLDNLRYLEQVRVEINCFNASHQMVNDAEDAIRKEMSRASSGSSQLNLEIRRLEKESMVAEEDQTKGHQVARTSSLKTQGNGNESDSMDLFKSTMKTVQAEPVVGQAPLSTAEAASKVFYHNISNNTFLKNVGILMSSTKIKKSTERMLQQEQTTEQQCSIALHHEVDKLKQVLANTQREFEEFKKQIEEKICSLSVSSC